MTRILLMACVLTSLLCGCGPPSAPTQAPAEAAPASRPPDTRRIHALIVGIDRYRYSDAHQPSAVFSDLRGAVGDALRFKQALADLYGVEVDVPAAGACDSSNAATITLTDDCATRARILEALQQRIASLRAGDTLLFYFAGHGSRYRDDEARDQDTGYNGTILPTDARNPDGSPGDIFDVELKALKDRATAQGLYFVSVFDSCNSATATRTGAAGQSRSAPTINVPAPPSSVAAAPAAVATSSGGNGYWVHLAAAQDGEEAQETGGGTVGTRAGVFTTALLDTLRMPGMRDATFGDLIHEVRLRVAARGHAAQTPSAEGALTAAVGARSRTAVLYDVEHAGTATTLQAGTTSGITSGSRFALYANQADAVARRSRLAAGSISTVDGTAATLALDAAPGALPKRLVAEEIAHFLPGDALTVAIDLPAGPARDAAEAALSATGFAVESPTGVTRLVADMEHAGAVALRADDGTLLVRSLGPPNGPGFGDRLTEALRKVARVQQLLALRTSGATADDADPLPVAACIAADGYRPTACPPLQAGGVRRIGMGERITATVINRGMQPAYIYVLAIDPYNAVDLVLPKPGEFDQSLPPNQPYRRSGMSFDAPGAYRFVVIASARPIRADAFQQAGNGTRDLAACTSPLERLLCASSEGRRDAGVAAVGDWSAQVSTVLTTPEDVP
ncbi:caspase family protein [Lysobacter sp. S4-A87]|uniref:caspase family protein n=1 Tax=Lysobacter sp. S4-A87 TaxID=2925843 RepID=UPI001F53A58A|nr:caspase family protein [Lysobacter sp. S4-A87]UNK48687.1 caspase family protein [Lysobacter sp. S4-A87]